MEKKDIYPILSRILEMDVDETQCDTELESVENWDSLAGITLIAQLAVNHCAPIKPNDLKNFRTIGELVALFE